MAWILLIIAGLLETVWAVALDRSSAFSKLGPSLLFLVSLAVSMVLLAVALRDIPVGTGYAVWVGIGATGTALMGMLVLGEQASPAKLFCLACVIGGIVGLSLVDGH